MSIQDLPDELLLLIFQSFADSQEGDDPFESINIPSEKTKSNTSSLASLSKVCIKWHYLAEPILYSNLTKPSNISLERDILPGQNMYTHVPPKQSLKLFLRTIIEQPHLAKSIKKLVLGSWVDSVNLIDGVQPCMIGVREPEADIWQTYLIALERLVGRGPMYFTGWLDFINNVLNGSKNSELILLLLSIPNLRTLQLAQMPVIEDWILIGAGGLANHLSNIQLGSVGKLQSVQLFRLRMLMTLPNLTALTLVNCSVQEYSGVSCPRARLTNLSILHCRVSKIAFELLTRHIVNIKSFEWIGIPREKSHLEPMWPGYDNGIVQKIQDFVKHQKLTLRTLHLLGDGLTFVSVDRLSFRDFESLERLEICSKLLHDESIGLYDQLPQSLKHLRINQSCSHMTHKLEVLVSSRALPNLKRIEYGHPCVLSSIQLLFEGPRLDRLKKLEHL
jgi:hypothetical protein